MAAMKTGLFKTQQQGKGTQKEILKAMHRKRRKIAKMEIVINEPRKDNVHEDMRAAASTI